MAIRSHSKLPRRRGDNHLRAPSPQCRPGALGGIDGQDLRGKTMPSGIKHKNKLKILVDAMLVFILIAVATLFVLVRYPRKGNVWGQRVRQTHSDLRLMALYILRYDLDNPRPPGMVPMSSVVPDVDSLSKSSGLSVMTVRRGSGGEIPGLTTPVSYLSGEMNDPYAEIVFKSAWPYAYYELPEGSPFPFIVYSMGPDGRYDIVDPSEVWQVGESLFPSPRLVNLTYDPTNGVRSRGDIWRCY